jgi:hypothetical protein
MTRQNSLRERAGRTWHCRKVSFTQPAYAGCSDFHQFKLDRTPEQILEKSALHSPLTQAVLTRLFKLDRIPEQILV